VSYISTTLDLCDCGLGTTSTGQTVGAAGSAAASLLTGAINLYYGITGLREQRRMTSETREDIWSAEIDAINQAELLSQQDAEILAAQNAVVAEQERQLASEQRRIGLETEALEARIARERSQAQRAAQYAAAEGRWPSWAWWALGGFGVAALVGAAAFLGTRAETA